MEQYDYEWNETQLGRKLLVMLQEVIRKNLQIHTFGITELHPLCSTTQELLKSGECCLTTPILLFSMTKICTFLRWLKRPLAQSALGSNGTG